MAALLKNHRAGGRGGGREGREERGKGRGGGREKRREKEEGRRRQEERKKKKEDRAAGVGASKRIGGGRRVS